MSSPFVSYVIATYNRRQSLARVIESVLSQSYDNFEIVVVCNSTDSTPELFEDGRFSEHESIRYHHVDERLGVIRARNLGYELADGEILVTVDDDAVFASPRTTANVVRLLEPDHVGIVAMKVVNGPDDTVEFPLPGSDLQERVPLLRPPMREPPADGPTRVTTFTGCGNAIHREVFETIGRFPPTFDYGSEELDFSLRALDAGFDIVYSPDCRVIHYEDPAGRFTGDKILKENLTNRLSMSIRNHPARYVVLSFFLWTTQLLIRSGGDLSLLFDAYADLLSDLRWLLANRDPISDRTISRVNELGGRIY
ncbi:glycosyltransferase family 2 protein [Haloplanus litoreus]|uniref:Glycosyltransferase family 2 protein n=1 Tax=Haloplanus litoreus TaxID=767515 RepID=A0ABD5ZVI8_9EURY